MKFAIKTGQSAYTYDGLSSIWSTCEELGLDSAWLHDHFLSVSFADRPSDPCLEASTASAYGNRIPQLSRPSGLSRWGMFCM